MDDDTISKTFDSWLSSCLNNDDVTTSTVATTKTTFLGDGTNGEKINEILRSEAKSFFLSTIIRHRRPSNEKEEGEEQSQQRASDDVLSSSEGASSPSSSVGSNKALALLIAKLGPAMSSESTSIKINALHCLCGAIEGCCFPSDDDGGTGAGGISYKMMELIGKFLLEHCKPLALTLDEEEEEECDKVRDAGVLCLSFLVRCPTTMMEASKKKKKDDGEEEDKESGRVVEETILLRLDLAKKGVEYRCASPEGGSAEYDHGYGDRGDEDDDVRGGLSTLPRAKRSLCFELLNSALVGVKMDTAASSLCAGGEGVAVFPSSSSELKKRLRQKMAHYATFVTTCLHGESDPRCLLQMLHLLHFVQTTFLPYFIVADSNGDGSGGGGDAVMSDVDDSGCVFPTMDVFDSVAPYYPIQFTPPPNDVHGITRKKLHDALMSVLYCTDYDHHNLALADGSVNDDAEERTMLSLSTRLFLERLSPPPKQGIDPYGETNMGNNENEMNDTVVDKIDALDDLTGLLLPVSSGNEPRSSSSPFDNATPKIVQELSNTLVTVHADASSNAISIDGTEGKRYKELANQTRELVAKLASQFEYQWIILPTDTNIKQKQKKKNNKLSSSLWKIFVYDTIQNLVPILGTAPQSFKGRTNTAYLSSLSSCGGSKTLRTCLDCCLPPLLDTIEKSKKGGGNTVDEEQITAATYAVGAFFSSYRVAVERSGERAGVVMHPHPLQAYGGRTLRALCDILGINISTDTTTTESDPVDSSPPKLEQQEQQHSIMEVSTKIASIRALDSLILSTPSSILSSQEVDLVHDVLSKLTDVILNDSGKNDDPILCAEQLSSERHEEWKSACARTLGSALGRCLRHSKGDDDQPMEEENDGAVVGDEGESSVQFESLLDDDTKIVTYVQQTIYPRILSSATSSLRKTASGEGAGPIKKRYDWIVLSIATRSSNKHVSDMIISSLVNILVEKLGQPYNQSPSEEEKDGKDQQQHPAMAPAMALSYLLKRGGQYTCISFHGLSSSPTQKTPMSIIRALCRPSDDEKDSKDKSSSTDAQKQGGPTLQVGMSHLLLPESRERTRTSANKAVKLAYDILPCILPAYNQNNSVPSSQRDSIVQFVSQVLPPLSDWDEVKLCVSLPILAAVLRNNVSPTNSSSGNVATTGGEGKSNSDIILSSMVQDLTDFALSTDYDTKARKAAVSCLFYIVLNYQVANINKNDVDISEEEEVCLSRVALRKSISPSIAIAAERLSKVVGGNGEEEPFDEKEWLSSVGAFQDSLNLAAVVGSAAACRGKSSSPTADLVVQFLIRLLCTKSALTPMTNSPITIDIIGNIAGNAGKPQQEEKKKSLPSHHHVRQRQRRRQNRLLVIVASAFGSMLSVQNGGPFWKQRVTHMSLSEILPSSSSSQHSPTDGGDGDAPNLGSLLAACYVACCVPITAIGKAKLEEIVTLIVNGLVYSCTSSEYEVETKGNESSSGLVSAKTTILGALVKLLSVAPNTMSPFAPKIVSSVLLIISSSTHDIDDNDTKSTGESVPCQLLALQCLIDIASLLPHSRNVDNFVKANKLTVISNLASAIDHPSHLIRQAAVEVRNTWCVHE